MIGPEQACSTDFKRMSHIFGIFRCIPQVNGIAGIIRNTGNNCPQYRFFFFGRSRFQIGDRNAPAGKKALGVVRTNFDDIFLPGKKVGMAGEGNGR